MTANNNKFYFDYQNGQYGYNTDPARGADTFSPFRPGFNGEVDIAYFGYNIDAISILFENGIPKSVLRGTVTLSTDYIEIRYGTVQGVYYQVCEAKESGYYYFCNSVQSSNGQTVFQKKYVNRGTNVSSNNTSYTGVFIVVDYDNFQA